MTGSALPVKHYVRSDFEKWIEQKNEKNANEWAIDWLLTPLGIWGAVENGYGTLEEIASYFGVTVEFLEKALAYYNEKNIDYCGYPDDDEFV